jgi:hypothetical protein
MGSLRKFEGLLFPERPLDEPVPLFPADERLYGGGQATGLLSLRERPSETQLRLQRVSEKHRLTRSCSTPTFPPAVAQQPENAVASSWQAPVL